MTPERRKENAVKAASARWKRKVPPMPRSKPFVLSQAGQPNWTNQTIWTGDNLDIMRGMDSASV